MKKLILLLLFIPLVFSCSKGETIKYNLNVSSNPINAGDLDLLTIEINNAYNDGPDFNYFSVDRF